ncbi:hypothetical protein MASR2M70_14470 [Bacillota bacterium]
MTISLLADRTLHNMWFISAFISSIQQKNTITRILYQKTLISYTENSQMTILAKQVL